MGALLVLLSAVVYGGSPILIKVAYAHGAPPLAVLSIRYLVAAALMWTGIALFRVRLAMPRRLLLGVALVGTVLVPAQVFSFLLALLYLPASTTSVLAYTYPLHVAWIGALFLGERVSREEWLTLAAVAAGAALVAGQTPALALGAGLAALAAATMLSAVYYVAARRLIRDAQPVPAMAVILLGAAGVLTAAAALAGELSLAYPREALAAIAGTGVLASLLAPLLVLAGLRSLPAARAAMLGTLEPVITVVLSVLLLDDRLTAVRALGMAIVIGGIALVQVRRPGT
jgi:drug/metabolite transporter (DMT)-like permease